MWRHIASNAIMLLIVGLFLLGGLVLWGKSEYTAEGPLDAPICLRVEPGMTMDRISRRLDENGAISSGPIFRIGADYTEKASQLKAGSFLVPAHASMQEITDIVTRGGASTCGTEIVYRIGVTRQVVQVRELDPEAKAFVELAAFNPAQDDVEVPQVYTDRRQRRDTRYRIALAEGVTSWQVVEALKGIDVLSGQVEVPEEGRLAPDSYEVRVGDSRASVIQRMEEAQAVRIAAAWEGRSEDTVLKSPEEMLILASIIEKETGVPQERRQVASVFTNRLKRGMRLQTDPTVIYGITKGQGSWVGGCVRASCAV